MPISSPLDLIAAHPWRRAVFTTYALSLSFFEAVVLDALMRGGAREALIIADVALVATFVADAQMDPQQSTARAWLDTSHLSENGPVDLINRLSTILNDPERMGLAAGIVDAIAFSIANATEPTEHFDRHDRLPLTRAKREAVAWENEPAGHFARHVLEAWVLAQHVYWSVGRGLADARARGRQILRLKVVLDEGGWTLAPGVSSTFTPRPTPDRLETALSLADECGLL